MTNFDDELKSALRRQEPPQDFADRVLARAAKRGSRQVKPAWRDSWLSIFVQPLRTPVLRWASVAAASAALVLGSVQYRNIQRERERAQGEAAKERLLLALRIAGNKLQLARSRVDQINSEQMNSDQINADQPQNQQERE